jgi:DNA-binding GntR family transcriptional regulator
MAKFPKALQNNLTQSLADKVYKKLRAAIINGELAGGTRLVESAVAAQMKVSRTPVREALQKLASVGLVYSIPRVGYIVEELSESDVEDLFTTRRAIEQIVARWALKNISTQAIEQLEKNLQQTDVAIQSGKTERMIDLDKDFHLTIYKACRSKTLFQIMKTLSDKTIKFRIACIHLPEVARRAREGHFRIYQAILSGDAQKVDHAMRSHLEETKEDIVRHLKNIANEFFLADDWA